MSSSYSDFYLFMQDSVNNPFILGISLGFFTFILEDVATISGAIFASNGNISIWWSLLALYCGIILGDAGLYFFGKFGSSNRYSEKILQKRGVIKLKGIFQDHLFTTIFIARFIPGMRLTFYTACGFFNLPFRLFILATVCASCLWTTGLYFTVYFLGEWALEELEEWRWLMVLVIIIVVIFLPRFIFRSKINMK